MEAVPGSELDCVSALIFTGDLLPDGGKVVK